MKTLKIIVLGLLFFFSFKSSYSQIQEKEEWGWNFDYKKEVHPENSLQTILDSVFPGIKFLVQGWNRSRHTELFFIINNDTINTKLNIKQLQLDCALHTDSVSIHSVDALIKSFIYLDLIMRQGHDYFWSNDSITGNNICVKYELIDLSQNNSLKYRYLDSSRMFINYKATVRLNSNIKYECLGRHIKAYEAIYELQVIDGVVCGYSVTLIVNDKLKIEQPYEKITDPLNDYEKNRLNKTENKVKIY